jgi:hypothetical protein
MRSRTARYHDLEAKTGLELALQSCFRVHNCLVFQTGVLKCTVLFQTATTQNEAHSSRASQSRRNVRAYDLDVLERLVVLACCNECDSFHDAHSCTQPRRYMNEFSLQLYCVRCYQLTNSTAVIS